MRTSARATFALSLALTAVLFACLALAGNVKPSPTKSSSARAKAAAAQRARAKRTVKPAPRRTTSEQTNPQSTARIPQLPERYDSPREAAEFFRFKRLPAGATELPIEKYFEAQEQMREMPQYIKTEEVVLWTK